MRKSKYLGLKSGDWVCTYYGIDFCQPAYTKKRDANGKLVRSKNPGRQSYYYIFERLTSDAKAMKMIRLSAAQAKYIFTGERDVEYYVAWKLRKSQRSVKDKVSYSFLTAVG